MTASIIYCIDFPEIKHKTIPCHPIRLGVLTTDQLSLDIWMDGAGTIVGTVAGPKQNQMRRRSK